MEFPHSYFDDEIREGFYVSGIMKRTWAACLEVYLDVVKICEKYKLKWFADYGTTLGAVRHGGYIPWDDDFDIAMPRRDYMKLIEVLDKELPSNYVVKNCHTTKNDLLTRVDNAVLPCFDQDFLKKYHNCFFVSGIDIFPLDNMAPNKKEEDAHRALIQSVLSFQAILEDENRDEAELDRIFAAIEQLTGFRINRDDELVKQLYQAVESVCALYSDKKTDKVMLAPIWANSGYKTYPASCFDKRIWMDFEGISIPVSAEYDTQLKIEYGEYMKINKGGASHGYPCFDTWEQIVKGGTDNYVYEYKYNPEDLAIRSFDGVDENDKEILIIPYRASTWNTIEPIWKEYKNNKSCHVTVMLPPYYERNALGSYGQMHEEADLLPSYVDVTPYDAYDFEGIHPDVIYIQNPYDECNYTSTVHPFFYSKNLKQYTDKLVYVPWFIMDELTPDNGKVYQTMNYFVTVPGLFHADEIILQNENDKAAYIRKLTEFAGDETRDIWDEKIVIKDLSYKDVIRRERSGKQRELRKNLPEEWKKKIYDSEGNRKKILLYDISAPSFAQGGKNAIDKIKETLEKFKNEQDKFVLIWRENKVTASALNETYPMLYKEYIKIIEQYKSDGYGIYDELCGYKEQILIADAYYGDAGYIARGFEAMGKPAMVQYIKPITQIDNTQTVGLYKDSEGRVPFNVRSCVMVDEILYFIPDRFNSICRFDMSSKQIEIIDCAPEETINGVSLFADIKYYKDNFILIPENAKKIWIYNIKKCIWSDIEIRDCLQQYKFSFSRIFHDKIYIFPFLYKYIVVVDLNDYSVQYIENIFDEYYELLDNEYLVMQAAYACKENDIYAVIANTNLVFKFNMEDESYAMVSVGKDQTSYNSISYDGHFFYLIPKNMGRIVRWDGKNEISEILLPHNIDTRYDGLYGAFAINGELHVKGYNSDTIIMNLNSPYNISIVGQRFKYIIKYDEEIYSCNNKDNNEFIYYCYGEEFCCEDCSFDMDSLKESINCYIRKNKISFIHGIVLEDDVVDLGILLQDLLCINDKKSIIFMPYKASMWDSLESIWIAANEDANCDVKVVPIPYYDKNNKGDLTNYHYEGESFPDYVPIVDYRTYDLAFEQPDVIYIHNPYDDGNHVTSIAPEYYSSELKKYTDTLVYVPYYATSGGMSEGQALCKAYINADYIVVQAEKHIGYFDARIPREKLLALGSPKFDKVINTTKEDIMLPDGWRDKIQDKRVYFYNTSLNGMLSNTEAFFDKMRYVFDCFAGKEDACILWRPHPLFGSTIASVRPDYVDRYNKLKDSFITENIGIYDITPDINTSVAVSDAYIGDAGTSVTALFGVAGKPLFILDNNIHREPDLGDKRSQVITPYAANKQTKWKIMQGNKLYCAENDDFNYRYYCNLGEYVSGEYYRWVEEYNDRLYVFPANAQNILAIKDGKVCATIELERKLEQWGAFSDMQIIGDYAFLIPFKYPYIVRFNMCTCEIDYIDGCRDFITIPEGNDYRIGPGVVWNNYLMIASPIDKRVLAVDCETLELQVIEVDAKRYRGAVKAYADGDDIWLLPYIGTNVVRWNPMDGSVTEYNCRVDGLTCYKRPNGEACMQFAFGSMVSYDNKVLLAPLWGNKFVHIDKNTGNVNEYEIELDMEYTGVEGYSPCSEFGCFIRKINEGAVLLYCETTRRMYMLNLYNRKLEKLDIIIDMNELEAHEAGFAIQSEWLRYGCMENAFNSLQDFLEGKITGGCFDKETEIEAYSKIAVNGDGSAGEKIHRYIMEVQDI